MVTWPQVSIDANKNFDMCFACGQKNPIGLKLKFEWDGKVARAEFTPSEYYQGWSGIVHGGIITCILDEAMTYATYFEGLNCVTAKMQTRLKRPALINEPIIITGSITRKNRKLVETAASIFLKDGTLIAEGTATMFVFHTTRKNEKAGSDV